MFKAKCSTTVPISIEECHERLHRGLKLGVWRSSSVRYPSLSRGWSLVEREQKVFYSRSNPNLLVFRIGARGRFQEAPNSNLYTITLFLEPIENNATSIQFTAHTVGIWFNQFLLLCFLAGISFFLVAMLSELLGLYLALLIAGGIAVLSIYKGGLRVIINYIPAHYCNHIVEVIHFTLQKQSW